MPPNRKAVSSRAVMVSMENRVLDEQTFDRHREVWRGYLCYSILANQSGFWTVLHGRPRAHGKLCRHEVGPGGAPWAEVGCFQGVSGLGPR